MGRECNLIDAEDAFQSLKKEIERLIPALERLTIQR
jgi:hypothetical protein